MTTTRTTILEQCQVSPPPASVAAISIPLTFFDVLWLHFHPVGTLFFYEFPCSKSQFIQSVIPDLKHSLSLALKHFFPLAGKLIIPSLNTSTCKLPEICYSDGDSVSLTFAECSNDFYHLTGNHPRNVDDLFPLAPQLPPAVISDEEDSSSCSVSSVFALKVTLFPNHGISVGFVIDHVVGDASSLYSLRSAWASIAKQLRDGSGTSLLDGSKTKGIIRQPFYDRSVIMDPKGVAHMLWTQVEKVHDIGMSSQTQPATSQQVRATFVMSRAHIQRLKDMVITHRPSLRHVSSFTVVCAYAWTCMSKARAAVINGNRLESKEAEIEHIVFAMNCRGRCEFPIPENYFGNCVAPCWAARKSAELVDEGGFVVAAEAIGEAIHRKVNNNEGGVLRGVENWVKEFEDAAGRSLFGVAGSPRFDFYGIDFGWGKPKKVEVVSEKYSLFRCKDSDGDLEIGICFNRDEMEVFSSLFLHGLLHLIPSSVSTSNPRKHCFPADRMN